MKRGIENKSLDFVLRSFIVLFSINIVSAATPQESGRILGDFLAGLFGGIGNFLAGLFGQVNLGSAQISLLLLGLLLWMVLYSIVDQMFSRESQSLYSWNMFSVGVSLIITILSLMYLPEDLVNSIVLQYGVLGATILTVIPFMIMLYFTVKISKSLIISRVIWTVYVIYYFTIFSYKLVELGGARSWTDPSLFPYAAAIIAGIFIFFFIVPLRKLLFTGELQSKEERAIRDINFRRLGRKLEREETKSRTGTN